MIIFVPDYYKDFKCISDKCKHTCCVGWEIDVDELSLPRFLSKPEIAPYISTDSHPHITLLDGERCPFLNSDGLCNMIIKHGEDFLCDICKDHPRFRNFWSGITEIGIGLVCEEAARIILSGNTKMKLTVLDDDGDNIPLPEDEQWLWDLRGQLIDGITETGPEARLKEYLIFRHLPDALYDGMVEERIRFINESFREITDLWSRTDGSLSAKAECCRKWSYDTEYDDEVISERLRDYGNEE